MVKALRFLSYLFGFEKLTPNEKDYLHELNKRASIYMGFIVMGLEVWMLIRQIKKRVIVKVKEGQPLFDMMVKYTSRIDMLTLTEGVERMEEADFLNKVGCGRLQGYLFGKPVPKEVLYKRIEDKELTVSKNCL